MFAKLRMSPQQSSDSVCSKQNVTSGTFNGYNPAANGFAFLPLICERLTHTTVENYANVPKLLLWLPEIMQYH
jgi:spore cortex formation protein SpoVR/YcgB (stage V sporulation)